MIGRELASEAIALLGTAIAEMFEEYHPVAVHSSGSAAHDGMTKFRVLGSAGTDVATLAAAIDVLARRADSEE